MGAFGLRSGKATEFSDLSELFCRNFQDTAERNADGRGLACEVSGEAENPWKPSWGHLGGILYEDAVVYGQVGLKSQL